MPVIDLHCDTMLKLWEDHGKSELYRNSFCIDVEKLTAGNSLAQFFALFIDLKEHGQPYQVFQQMASLFFQEIEKNSAVLAFARSAFELERNREDGKVSCFLTIEEGGALEGKIENLLDARRLGVSLITLTWNYPNEIGYPNSEWRWQQQGLTMFGRELVEEMNHLGMLIDVSHLSDQGFADVAKLSKQPFVASHSNARAVTHHSRNLTDEMIKTLANKGGVIGLNFCADFLGVSGVSQVKDMVRHVLHIKNVGGSDVIALGSDFDGIDPQLEIEHMGQINKLVQALEHAGFSSGELEKFLWRNSERVIKEVLRS